MEKALVVGAGLVGSLQAVLLAKKGHQVDVYDRRGDIRNVEFIGGRSINLALSNRGWKALELAGIAQDIKDISKIILYIDVGEEDDDYLQDYSESDSDDEY